VVNDVKFYVDCDEVYPNLFVGNGSAAKNIEYLRSIGVTHVVNMAEDKGINEGGKVLVHCFMGYSRSATCAIAYLMTYKRMSAVTACQTVKSKHVCRPNDGFLQQLVELDDHHRKLYRKL
ncbi:Dual specificity protein phosphatase 3, partial [Pseudolycoriella hygida]